MDTINQLPRDSSTVEATKSNFWTNTPVLRNLVYMGQIYKVNVGMRRTDRGKNRGDTSLSVFPQCYCLLIDALFGDDTDPKGISGVHISFCS